MLGRFLELALVSADAVQSWQQFQQLGFASAATGDVWAHAYGVVACRDLAIGLHAAGDEPLSIVFVRPEVAALHRELTALDLNVEQARLGSDVFNELSLREPGGVLLRVLEARSFSPPQDPPEYSQLGRFVSLSLPCRDLDAAAAFWNRLGLHTTALQEPWEGLTVQHTPLAYHGRKSLPEPALLFQQPALVPDGMIGDTGLQAGKPLAALGDRPHSVLRTAEDLALIVLA